MSLIRTLTVAIAGWASCFVLVAAANAQASTDAGAISVAQLALMLDQASTDQAAQQVLTAYLAVVGETVGAVVDAGGAPCKRPLALTARQVRKAISTATEEPQASQTAATPLIVRDMLTRAGCSRG